MQVLISSQIYGMRAATTALHDTINAQIQSQRYALVSLACYGSVSLSHGVVISPRCNFMFPPYGGEAEAQIGMA